MLFLLTFAILAHFGLSLKGTISADTLFLLISHVNIVLFSSPPSPVSGDAGAEREAMAGAQGGRLPNPLRADSGRSENAQVSSVIGRNRPIPNGDPTAVPSRRLASPVTYIGAQARRSHQRVPSRVPRDQLGWCSGHLNAHRRIREIYWAHNPCKLSSQYGSQSTWYAGRASAC